MDDFEDPEQPVPATVVHAPVAEAEEEAEAESALPSPSDEPVEATVQETDAMDVTVNITSAPSPTESPTALHATSEPLPIRGAGRASHLRDSGTPSPPGGGAEGIITPRNNAGPWVFDGRAGRQPAEATTEMTSLDSAAEADITTHESSNDAASR